MNDLQIRMGKISYINASPVFYGLDHGLKPEWLTMIPDVPSVLNKKIMIGDIKISPISAAFYAMNSKDLLVLPDLSISCHGPVLSVLLASNYPIEELSGKKVIFSPESVSGVSFLKMIFRQKGVLPVYNVGNVSHSKAVSRTADAVLVIGDTALTQPWDTTFKYCIDLGEYWYDMTRMPFVFAVWAVRRSFARKSPETVRKIHRLLLTSKSQGYRHIDDIIDAGQKKLGIDTTLVAHYFERLYCDLDTPKIDAMKIFFDSLFEQKILNTPAEVRFFK